MFRPEPWAEAFVKTAGTASLAEEALEYLRVYYRAALTVSVDLFGKNDAGRLNRCIEAAQALVPGRKTPEKTADGLDAATLAGRFVQLMIRKDCFYRYKGIVRGIEKNIYKQKGIEEVIVETAVKPDEEFLAGVKEKVLGFTGAKEVKLISRVIPELIGGIRIRRGSMLLDYSIKYRLQEMAADLGSLNAFSGQEV